MKIGFIDCSYIC